MSATGVLVFDEDRISSLTTNTPGSVVVFDPDPGTNTAVLDDGTTDFLVLTAGGPPGPKGDAGATGASAYEIAVADGYVGTEAEWLTSLQGADSTVPGPEGPSAYDVAVAGGFVGTEQDWLNSLVGPAGADSTVPGPEGPSAYEVAVAGGYTGTEAEWLASLVGPQGPAGADSTVPGPDGLSAYQVAVNDGFVGTEAEWLASLVGPQGPAGTDGTDGVGVIPGGASGQVLAKASAADFDMAWTDPVTGGSGGVTSVNGEVGAVILTAADVGADATGTASSAVSTHSADTTAVHGIADTAALVVNTDARLSDARTPTAHKTTHATGGTDVLTAADIGAEAAGTAASAVAAHEADTTNVHGIADTSALVLTTDPRMTDARTPLAHTHPITDITALQTALDAKVEVYTFAVTGDVAVATGKSRVYLEGNYTLVSVRAAVNTAPAGASLIVDVNKNGATVYGTQANRPTIAAAANSGLGGAASVTSFAAGDYLQVDVDQVGSSTAGADLTVTIRLRSA